MKQFTAAMAKEFVQANLDFKRRISVLLVCCKVFLFYERDGLIGSFGRENVAERYILKAKVLSYIVVIGNVDTSGNANSDQQEPP